MERGSICIGWLKGGWGGNMGKEAGEPNLPQKEGKLWSSGALSHPSVWIPVFVWHLWCLSVRPRACLCVCTWHVVTLRSCACMCGACRASRTSYPWDTGGGGLQRCLHPGECAADLLLAVSHHSQSDLLTLTSILSSQAAPSCNMQRNYVWSVSRAALCTSVHLIRRCIQMAVVCKQGQTMWVENRGTWLEPLMTASACIQVSGVAAQSRSCCALASLP